MTRDNNGVLKNMVDELKTKNKEMEGHLRVFNTTIANRTNEIAVMQETIEELKKKIEE